MMMKKSFVAFGLAALAFTGSSRGGSVVFENANSLQNATRVDTITLPGDFQGDAQGLEVQLSMCSQSMSNYRANGVTVRFLRNGNEIASKTDSYPSESNWGSIPCYDHHVLRFPAIWMKSGESLQMETTVWSGDYANRLANQIVYAGDQVTPERRACTSSETLPFDHGKLENNEWGGTPAVQCVLSRDPGAPDLNTTRHGQRHRWLVQRGVGGRATACTQLPGTHLWSKAVDDVEYHAGTADHAHRTSKVAADRHLECGKRCDGRP